MRESTRNQVRKNHPAHETRIECLHGAIEGAHSYLLGLQDAETGCWQAELEANATIKDNTTELWNRIPFADHKAMIDPPTADVTARVLMMLGRRGHEASFGPAGRAIRFLRRCQEPDGSWYGRWGINYIYGTSGVLCGLESIGEKMDRPWVRRAALWFKERQNSDGGWGETPRSYEAGAPEFRGRGPSMPSQTAWALLGLLAAGEAMDPAVERGIHYLMERQGADGGWDEEAFTGTGFPGHFYIRYHFYRQVFPLMALGRYRRIVFNTLR